MAYYVAKELHMKPLDILENWTCEELMVAYGEYANRHSAEYVDTIPRKDWGKQKPPITELDRWSVLFVTPEQMAEMQKQPEEKSIEDKMNEMSDLARMIMG